MVREAPPVDLWGAVPFWNIVRDAPPVLRLGALLSVGELNDTAIAFCGGIHAALAIKVSPKLLVSIFCFMF
ncbi:MAG: hypothetical protein AAFY21_23180, partial [Cyanobacteria bacterium J06641_2]